MENILQILRELNEKYLETNNVTREIFVSLKSKRYDELKVLNGKQLLLMEEVQTLAGNFKNEITKKCEKNGIKEYKISNLLYLMTQSEKEKILIYERKIATSENELEKSLLINKAFLRTLIDVGQTMMDVVSHNAEVNMGREVSVFLNQKF